MADAFYDSLAEKAFDLVSRFGAPQTLRRVTSAGTLNTSNGTVSGRTVSDQTVYVVLKPRQDALVNGTMTLSKTRSLFMSSFAAPTSPAIGDKIVFSGDAREYAVTRVESVQPGGTLIGWHLEIDA